MDFVLENDDMFGKPDAASVMEVFGGPGVLSMSPMLHTQPYQRQVARDVINKFFTRNLKSDVFTQQLHHNINELLRGIVEQPHMPYDELTRRQRIAYLRILYFGESISDDDMATIYAYTESVFGKLWSLLSRKPIKDMLGRSWHEMTPQSIKQLQTDAEQILINVIDNRLIADDRGSDLFGEMITGISAYWDTPNHQMKLEIISGFLQILFASVDTTASAIGSILFTLGKDHVHQQQLRIHAKNLVNSKGDGFIEYSDFITTDNPDAIQFHRFVGRILVDHPPTPATARKALVNIRMADGQVIKKGTTIILHLSEAQIRASDDPTVSADDLMKSRIFGGGKTKCIGRPGAVYELFVTTIQLLNQTSSITLANPDEIIRHFGTTMRYEGMKLNVQLAE